MVKMLPQVLATAVDNAMERKNVFVCGWCDDWKQARKPTVKKDMYDGASIEIFDVLARQCSS
uniref:DNA-directed RNA polymerase n=1 Tax=Ascaris lumbricoides TaxID=6252 RepID=A0A0M3HFG8_ASCLU